MSTTTSTPAIAAGLSLAASLFLTAILFATAKPAASQETALIERGRAISQEKCAGCHATTTTGNSPMPEAPPFRDLHRKYDVEHLAEALAEGIVSGHPAMPEFVFPPDAIDAIITYIKSLSVP